MYRILLAVVLLTVFPLPVRSDATPPLTPLQRRARKACSGFDKLATEAQERARQRLLLALADTLEMQGLDRDASQCLERAGILGYQLSEYDTARTIFERGLAAARRSGDSRRIAALLNAVANIVSIQGDDARALDLQKQLILLRRTIGDPRGLAVSWSGLAYSYQALYRIPEAIEANRRALRFSLEAGYRYGIALIRTSLSNALFESGRIDEAMALADSAVADCERLQRPIILGNAYASRGHKRYVLGFFDDALDDFERARTVFGNAGADRLAAGAAANQAGALVALGRCDEATAMLERAIPVLERTRARAGAIAARAARGRALAACNRVADARRQLRQALDEFARFRDELDTELGRAESFRLAGAAFTDLAALEPPETAWAVVERGSASLMREQLGVECVTLADFQAHLAAIGATALQFSAATPERVLAFVVTPDAIARRVIALPRDFARDVATALRLLSTDGPDALRAPALERVARTLVSPLDLEGDRLVVIPGAFGGLPFEALPYRGAELGDRAAVSYAPSATAFVRMQDRTATSGRMLAVADPAVARDATDPFAGLAAMRSPGGALPEARNEVRHIAPRDALVLERDAATRARLLDAMRERAVIHFAAHAVVDATQPDRSAILLAGSDELDSRAIEHMTLRADLVSLSGCSTAGGYLVPGEGTFGLARAFLRAGARSVVASWWAVEDAAARRFMELFYARLRAGDDRDRALQKARLRMAKEGYPARDRLAFALVGATADPVPAVAGTAGPSPRATWPMAVGALALLAGVSAMVRARRARARGAEH